MPYENPVVVDANWPEFEPIVVGYCTQCCEPIYDGSVYYENEPLLICDDCLNEGRRS